MSPIAPLYLPLVIAFILSHPPLPSERDNGFDCLQYLPLHRTSISGWTTCICKEMVVDVDARGITARGLRIGLLGCRGREKKFVVNSFFFHTTDFTSLGKDAYVCTSYVRVRSIDLHKAQGLCSVLRRWEFFCRRACRHNCVTYVFGRCCCLTERSFVQQVFYGCLDPALSLMIRHWITHHTYSYRGFSPFLSRFSPIPITLDECTKLNIMRTPCLERGTREYSVDVRSHC